VNKKGRILVIGITPPPYGGQAMMTERLVNAKFQDLEIYHVRMSFSNTMASVGKFSMAKIFHMFQVVWQALICRIRFNTKVLYYMPGGSNFTPVARDIFILTLLRPLFKKTIFHFRAAGVSEVVKNKPGMLGNLAKFAYRKPDLAIHLSARNPKDGEFFHAKRNTVIPNGLEDEAENFDLTKRRNNNVVKLLYVGVIQETKGVLVLLEALRMLKAQGLQPGLELLGEFNSTEFEKICRDYCIEAGIENEVNFAGVRKGKEKWESFARADIFCFPSFFESESFGNVVVEAMMFGLPVIATRWRGIPDIVRENQTGLLVEIKNVPELANALTVLISDYNLRLQMGREGRNVYEQHYKIDRFLKSMELELKSVL
jgi:glycosyltransferase involved in cell wall biosynthesis